MFDRDDVEVVLLVADELEKCRAINAVRWLKLGEEMVWVVLVGKEEGLLARVVGKS